MPRETKKITTPLSAQVVELRTYLIGREKRALQNIFLGKNLAVSLDAQNITGIDAEVLEKAQELAWNTVIASIDGNAENIVEKVLDMRSEDYEFVLAAVNEITAEKKS